MMTAKAISPQDAREAAQARTLPNEVVEAVNDLLSERSKPEGRVSCRIEQDELIKLIIEKFADNGRMVTREEVFDNKWLDIEYTFRKAGWSVSYDRPGYNETYEPFFEFAEHNNTVY